MTWRPVVGDEELYEGSDVGEVRRMAGFWCRTARPLKLHPTRNGYLRVSLTTRASRNPRRVLVHRLVFEAFCGPIPGGMTVNHRNGVKTDNRPTNFALATMSEQMNHAYATGLQRRAKGEARGHVAKLTDEAVREIRRLYRPRTSLCRELATRFGVSMACIQSVIRGDRWSHI